MKDKYYLARSEAIKGESFQYRRLLSRRETKQHPHTDALTCQKIVIVNQVQGCGSPFVCVCVCVTTCLLLLLFLNRGRRSKTERLRETDSASLIAHLGSPQRIMFHRSHFKHTQTNANSSMFASSELLRQFKGPILCKIPFTNVFWLSLKNPSFVCSTLEKVLEISSL